jgi:PAS domain S-box-containing protein
MSTLVLLVTHDQALTERVKSVLDSQEDALSIVFVDRLLDATDRLKTAAGVQAVILDWDLPDTPGFEAFLVLMGAAPHLPILVLGDDPNLLQQMNLVEHGAQDYLLKRRLDADTLINMVHSSIARKSREGILFVDKERAQITLNSMGDAVLSTDSDWSITFLNPVAEKLVGWTYGEAAGRHWSEVFQVLHGTTRERLVPQMEAEVEQGRTMILPPNCILVRRDGHESPIEDSAAPIHDRGNRAAGMVVVFHDASESHATTEHVRSVDRQIITGDLRHAVGQGEFTLAYQPKVNLISGAITGVEALIRWRHPSRGLLRPVRFIPVAEDCGLIEQIGQWALREACIQAQAWVAAGLEFGTMAVNVSAVEFRSDRFFDGVCSVLRTTGLEPRFLQLELTETAVMRNLESASVVLRALSTMGVRIAVDDFGTGYSNLNYLKRFPIDTLKLDKSFVHDIPESAKVATIVRSVIRMAQNLNLTVVAEGVENRQQLKFLQAHDCSEGQGYYFSKPVASAEFESLLALGERHWAWQFRSPALRAS